MVKGKFAQPYYEHDCRWFPKDYGKQVELSLLLKSLDNFIPSHKLTEKKSRSELLPSPFSMMKNMWMPCPNRSALSNHFRWGRFWTEDWVFAIQGYSLSACVTMAALWVSDVDISFPWKLWLIQTFKKLETTASWNNPPSWFMLPCWLFCKKWHAVHNENTKCRPFQVKIPRCTNNPPTYKIKHME